MFRKSSKDKKIQKINEFLKVLPESQIDQALEALVYGRISAVQKTKYVESTTETKIVESDKVTETTTEKIQEATKPKVESNVFRYFLQDDTKKGICSAQIKKICGHKAIWKRATTGKKNQYVSGIEGMKSDEVDKTMQQFKNLEKYFVKSPYKAKIWSRN